MLSINMDDVMQVVSNIQNYLIAFGVVLVLALLVMFAVRKMPKAKKKMIRAQSGLAILLALAIVVNLICTGPMSTMLDLVSGEGSISEETSAEATELVNEITQEGIVLAQNDDNILPVASGSKLNVFGWASTSPCYGGTGSGALNDAYPVTDLLTGLHDAGIETNDELSKFYTDYCSTRPSVGMAQQDWTLPEPNVSLYTDEMMANAKEYSDTAMVVITRVGGEGADLPTDMSAVVDGSWVRRVADYRGSQRGAGYYNGTYDDTLNEGNDWDAGDHFLQLSNREEELIDLVTSNFDNVIVVYNGANAFEMDWVKNYPQIKGVLLCPGTGQSGFEGFGRVVAGEVNPSGHTTATFAANSLSAPSAENFGLHAYNYGSKTPRAAGDSFVSYNEGIYVGYRYYETRYEDTILGQGNADSTVGTKASTDGWNYAEEVCFPFGYGLSYTNYEYNLDKLDYNSDTDTFTATVTVSNTGDRDGKATVELYAQTPYTDYDKQNNVEKSSIQLLGYDKIDVAAGASETVTVDVPGYFLASYDANGAKGYILDAGDYYFAVGNGAHEALNNVLAAKCGDAVAGKLIDQDGNVVTGNTAAVATWTAPNTEVDTQKYRNSRYNSDVEVTNTFDDADVNYWANDDEKITYLSRSAWDTTYPTTLETLTVNDKLYNGLNMQTYVKAADAKSVSDFNLGVELDEKINFSDMIGVAFDDPKWNDFLSQLTLSDLLINMGDSKGIKAVKAVNKPGCTIVDGPEGMNGQFKYGDRRNCTGWATLPIVGATWNHDVQTRFGEMYGEDALYASIPIAYAPGADTLRSPYSGRTSEYFSEDGVLSYYAAKAVSHGMRNKGLIGTVKHFFLNEQEAGRQGISTFANEQSIREIYMRAFEGSLAEGDSLGVMTAYNRIGVMYAAANQGIQHILRDEWNYGGYIIDDALTASEYSSAPEMLMAGNNIFCLDTARPNEIEKLITSTDDGDLLQKVIDSNHYLYYIMLQSSMGGSGAEDVVVSDAAPWWQTTLRALDVVFCALAVAAVVMYVLHTYTDVFSEEKRKNRAAKKN